MTMVVVMLSSTADMKKVIVASSQSSRRLSRVRMRSVMTLNPPWTSISSTMVMAPIRKTRISHVSPKAAEQLRGRVAAARERVESPYGRTHHQCDGRFVDAGLVLQRDERVAHREEE